jgi:hypothetical protein
VEVLAYEFKKYQLGEVIGTREHDHVDQRGSNRWRI